MMQKARWQAAETKTRLVFNIQDGLYVTTSYKRVGRYTCCRYSSLCKPTVKSWPRLTLKPPRILLQQLHEAPFHQILYAGYLGSGRYWAIAGHPSAWPAPLLFGLPQYLPLLRQRRPTLSNFHSGMTRSLGASFRLKHWSQRKKKHNHHNLFMRSIYVTSKNKKKTNANVWHTWTESLRFTEERKSNI